MRTDLSKVMATLFKLAVVSFVVGWLLVQFDITPEAIFDNFGATVRKIYDTARGVIEWSAGYIVIGAVIVIPIWLIAFLFGALKSRRKSD